MEPILDTWKNQSLSTALKFGIKRKAHTSLSGLKARWGESRESAELGSFLAQPRKLRHPCWTLRDGIILLKAELFCGEDVS
jgi:hypothetical protein